VYNELLVETARVIDGLIPSLREAMVLGPIQGGSCEDVAKVLGIAPAAFKSRLHRARASTKEAMWRVEHRGVPLIVAPASIQVVPLAAIGVQ